MFTESLDQLRNHVLGFRGLCLVLLSDHQKDKEVADELRSIIGATNLYLKALEVEGDESTKDQPSSYELTETEPTTTDDERPAYRKCETGCKHFSEGVIKHHPDCVHYPDDERPEYRTLTELEGERFAWSMETFTEATAISSLRKLESETKEIEADILNGSDPTEEYADALMCLFDSAGRHGITVEQMTKAFAKKLEINKARVWRKNPDNSYSHV